MAKIVIYVKMAAILFSINILRWPVGAEKKKENVLVAENGWI